MLNARSVLVTGSNRGIGLELVRQLAGKSKGPEWVFATCRDPEGPRAQDLKNLAAKNRCVIILQMDTSDPSSIKAATAKVTEKLQGAGLNLLINNAGIIRPSTLESETPEVMAEVYKNNVIGPMTVSQVLLDSNPGVLQMKWTFSWRKKHLNWGEALLAGEGLLGGCLDEPQCFLVVGCCLFSQAFLPLLRKASRESPQKGMSCSKAAIVNVSSLVGSITELHAWAHGHVINYRCSKAALNMLTRCQSMGFAEDEILCVALHPGWVQTDMGNAAGQAPLTVDASVRAILSTLGRLTEEDTSTFVNWEGAVVPW